MPGLDDRDDARHEEHLRRARRASSRPSPEKRDRILDNMLYKYISTSLAGTQEYMAMEKLYAVKDDPRYDLIAPRHAADGRTRSTSSTRPSGSSARSTAPPALVRSGVPVVGKLSFNLLAKSAAAVLRGIGRLTGRAFEAIAEFIGASTSSSAASASAPGRKCPRRSAGPTSPTCW